MSDPFDILTEEEASKLKETRPRRWTEPMLATLTDERFSDPAWLYERKLDGERCLAFRDGDGVRMLSRNRNALHDTYPELREALDAQDARDFIVDGEIVAFEGRVTSFARLQQRMKIRDATEARKSPVAAYFYLFDLLRLNGRDCDQLPLRARKRLLRSALDFRGRLRFTPHRNARGEAYLREACGKGWEGLIAKRADATYAHARSRDWLKFKCASQQEFVIAGYTDPAGERKGFGAIVVAYHEDDQLVCAGKVGTGFDDDTLRDLGERMRRKQRDTTPIDRGEAPAGDIHWITPDLVAEVAFTEWTEDDRLRHPRFLGLRRDKPAREVVRESPEPAP